MADPREKIIRFIEDSNAFEVMGEFRKQNLLTKEDIAEAMSLSREEWLIRMKTAAGVLPED
jgi:hypothetical protein